MKQEDKEKITQAEEILERLKVQRGGNVLSIHKKMANKIGIIFFINIIF